MKELAKNTEFWIEQKQEMQITDWKGNAIKHGDEICLIKIKDKSYFGKVGMMIPGQGMVCSTEEPEPNKNCWKVGEYLKVDENLCITVKHGYYTFTQPISICMAYIDTSCLILAIKGVSDVNPKKIIYEVDTSTWTVIASEFNHFPNYFYTYQEAKDFIISNRPPLSVKDTLKVLMDIFF